MNNRTLIKHLMKEKSDALQRVTGLKLYWKGDFKNIDSMPNKEIAEVIRCFKILFPRLAIDDAEWCPSCIIDTVHNNNCRSCLYGKRHGECDESDSTYSNIRNRVGGSDITDVIGQKVVERLFKYNFNTCL